MTIEYIEPEIQIDINKIFKSPIHCLECKALLDNDNTTVMLEPVAQSNEQFPETKTKVIHMLCITKITCESCGASFLLLSPQTVAEQLKTKFSDREYEILDSMYNGDDDHWSESESDRLNEYVCELTYVKKTRTLHTEMQLHEHDASQWTL